MSCQVYGTRGVMLYVMLSSQHVSSSVVVSREERVTDHRRHAQDESAVEREWDGMANPDIR